MLKPYEYIVKIIMALFKIVCIFWRWLNKHELISGFFVTMLGVLAAFWLTGLGEQNALDRTTAQKLHLVVLEAIYNRNITKEILEDYAKVNDANVVGTNVKRLNSVAATAAFQDGNVLSFLPHHKVTFLLSYLNAISGLNQVLQVHQGVLESQGYKRTTQENDVRKYVHNHAAGIFAMTIVLQEELDEYFDEKLYDKEKIRKLEDRMKYIKAKDLKGEDSLYKEE